MVMGINTTKELRLTVFDDGLLHFGQRVYVVASAGSRYFHEKCPVCDDVNKVTIRGYEFSCPNCSAMYSHKNSSTSICIQNFDVNEYIINTISVIGDQVRSAYKCDGSIVGDRYPHTRYEGFCRKGNGNHDVKKKAFCKNDFREPSEYELSGGSYVRNEFCFLTKKEAAECAKKFNDYQRQRLEEFNKAHGTVHEYPFDN